MLAGHARPDAHASHAHVHSGPRLWAARHTGGSVPRHRRGARALGRPRLQRRHSRCAALVPPPGCAPSHARSRTAYGETGTGKVRRRPPALRWPPPHATRVRDVCTAQTWTMFGPQLSGPMRGVVPRAAGDLFRELGKIDALDVRARVLRLRAHGLGQVHVTVSMLEIYNVGGSAGRGRARQRPNAAAAAAAAVSTGASHRSLCARRERPSAAPVARHRRRRRLAPVGAWLHAAAQSPRVGRSRRVRPGEHQRVGQRLVCVSARVTDAIAWVHRASPRRRFTRPRKS